MPPTEDGRPIDRNDRKGKRILSPSDVTGTLRENYRFSQYQVVQYLAEHLTDCRRAVGGDLDDVMILAVLGQRALGAVYERKGQAELVEERAYMSALRIADVTGIPRESTRRKLVRLAGRGWVEQHSSLGWRLAGRVGQTQVSRDLADVNQRGMDRLGRMIAALLPLFLRGEEPESRD